LIVVISFLAAVVFSVILIFLIRLFCSEKIRNYWFTKYVYSELLIAVTLRLILCIVYGFGTLLHWRHALKFTQLNDIFFLIPYYLVIKVSFDLPFGWLQL
jgi:hypothetical protein